MDIKCKYTQPAKMINPKVGFQPIVTTFVVNFVRPKLNEICRAGELAGTII